MSAYNKGSQDINMLIEVLTEQTNNINDYNNKANTALDKELRDIMISYRNNEIKSFYKTLEALEAIMPEFKEDLPSKTLGNYTDIGIGDLK